MKHFTYCEDSGRAALIFDAEFYNHEIIRSALRLPFLTELLGKPYYAFAAGEDDGRIIISSWLESVPSFPNALIEGGELIIVNKAIHWLSLKKLYAQCYDLAKFGTDCSSCPKKGRACMESLLMKCANEHGLSFTLNPEHPFMEQIDIVEKDDLQKLDHFLRNLPPDSTWKYVSPHLTSDLDLVAPSSTYTDRRQTLRSPTEHDFTCIDEIRQRYCDRSHQAAKTRKAIKRCKSECILYPSCNWCTKPFYGAPFHCQKGKPDSYYRGKGPYPLERIRNNVALPDIPRDIVSLVANNGGLETKIFGYMMQLQRMDFNQNTVEFIPSYRKSTTNRQSFSIEDALKLCKIPYRENGEYVKQEFNKPPRLMDDDELRLYLLCCNYNETKSYPTMFRQVTSSILSIVWLPQTKSICITTDKGWSVNPISEYHDLLGAFGQDVLRFF